MRKMKRKRIADVSIKQCREANTVSTKVHSFSCCLFRAKEKNLVAIWYVESQFRVIELISGIKIDSPPSKSTTKTTQQICNCRFLHRGSPPLNCPFLCDVARRWLLFIFLNAIYITRHTIWATYWLPRHKTLFHFSIFKYLKHTVQFWMQTHNLVTQNKNENQRLKSLDCVVLVWKMWCAEILYTWKQVESVQLKEKQRNFPKSHTKSLDCSDSAVAVVTTATALSSNSTPTQVEHNTHI